MKLYIPTINRQGKQKTAAALDTAGLPYTLVVPPDQVKDFPGDDVLACPAKGIRGTRQWIMEHGKGKFAMLDDDLTFYKRTKDGKLFRPITGEALRAMFKVIEAYLDSFAHLGLTDKFMSQTKPRGCCHNGRFTHLLAYNKRLFPAVHPTFRVEVCEEHDVNLQLLLAGKASVVLTEYSKGESPRAPGGCNTWRHQALEEKACKKMESLFPGLVKADGIKIRVNWRGAAKQGGCAV